MNCLCQQISTEWRDLTRLHNHGAAHEHGWADLGGDLIQRVVPWRDAANHANRFLDNKSAHGCTLLEGDVVDQTDARRKVHVHEVDLHLLGKVHSATQLALQHIDALGFFRLPLLKDQLHGSLPLGHGTRRPVWEGRPGGGDGVLHVLGSPLRHTGEDLRRVGVDDIHPSRASGLYPLAIDVLVIVDCHVRHPSEALLPHAQFFKEGTQPGL
mmetsp:Transcript_113946/g.285046  ORF Transcript_113946/g.285046 Transcript_113946/m.285046 type:complete len:212 (+) Transcript_113946:959-1594(+)